MASNRYTQFQPDAKPPTDEELIAEGKELLNKWLGQLETVKKTQEAERIRMGFGKSPAQGVDAKESQETAARQKHLASDACAYAVGCQYISPSHAVVFHPEVLDVILSPNGLEALKLGIISGATVEKLVSQQEVDRSVEMLKDFIDPNKRLDYLLHPEDISTQIFPKNAPKPQF